MHEQRPDHCRRGGASAQPHRRGCGWRHGLKLRGLVGEHGGFGGPWNYENATSGTITYDDVDGMGELGFYFYIDTPMKDNDGNGEGDACESFFDDGGSVTVTRDGEGDAANEFTQDCSMPEPGEDGNVDAGMTRIGYACDTLTGESDCTDGDYSFTASSGVHVMYVDPVLAALFEGLGALFGGGALASAAACCGLPLGLLLLIIGLVSSNGP